MDVETTTAVRHAEVTVQRHMIERVQERFDVWPARLAADTAYGDASNLAWLVDERGIEPHIPVFDKSARSDFKFGHEHDRYVCPAGKNLHPSQRNSAVSRSQVD